MSWLWGQGDLPISYLVVFLGDDNPAETLVLLIIGELELRSPYSHQVSGILVVYPDREGLRVRIHRLVLKSIYQLLDCHNPDPAPGFERHDGGNVTSSPRNQHTVVANVFGKESWAKALATPSTSFS
jgi:hypothetical protein